MSRAEKTASLMEKLTAIVQEEAQMDEQTARDLARAVTRGLIKCNGGRDMYVPARDNFERNQGIRRDFNGRNIDELRARFGVSRTTIYRIIK